METYIRFEYKGEIKYGILEADRIVVLEGEKYEVFKKTKEIVNIYDVNILAPCVPSKAVGLGLNYKDAKLEAGKEFPKSPLLFLKPSTSIINNMENIIKWPMVKDLRYEGELAVVIGKKASCIQENKSLEYIWGFTIANDVTAHDMQEKDTLWTRGKSFNTFLPLGPNIVKDIDYKNLEITSKVNGKLEQKGNTSNMIFGVEYLVSYISHVMTLLPGDVILTGTPGGYGGKIISGDKIEIEISGIGKLTNYVKECETSWFIKS